MVLKVILSDESIADLKGICEVVGEDNPEAAAKLGRDLLAATRRLGEFPRMDRVYSNIADGDLLVLACRGCRIFYVVGEVVEIRHVRHGARDEPEFE